MSRHDIFGLIDDERERQEDHVRAGRFKASCASDQLSPTDKAAVLSEECGEVSGAALAASQLTSDRVDDRADLRKELIHVAAVAVAWLESLEPPAAIRQAPLMAFSIVGLDARNEPVWFQNTRETEAPRILEGWCIWQAEQIAAGLNGEPKIVSYVFECTHPVVGARRLTVTADRVHVEAKP